MLYFGLRDAYIGLLQSNLARSATAAAPELGDLSPVRGEPMSRLALEAARLTGARATIVGADGTVLADSAADPASLENHATRPEIQAALAGRTGSDISRSASTGEEMLYVAASGRSAAGTRVAFRLAVPLTEIGGAISRLRALALIPLLVASVIGIIVGWRSAGRIAAPFRSISGAAREMAGGGLSVRAPVEGADEAIELARSLNRMASAQEADLLELAAAKRRLETLLAGLPVGVMELDRGYNVQSANIAAQRLLGFEIEAVLGRHYAGVLPARYGLSDAVVAALEGGESRTVEIDRGRGLDDVLQVSASPRRDPAGMVTGAVLVLEDLGQTRRDARARRELVANVSHELKTPVAAIGALAETLASGAMSDPEAAARFLEHIRTESARLARLVDDLLELARIEANETELAKRPVDLGSLIRRTVDRMAPLATQKSQRLDFEGPAPATLTVMGDEAYLERAVGNLVENALKYTPEGGWVRVGTAGLAAGEALVEVTDNGVGLTSEAAGRVFERFYRASPDRSRQTGGTGLGLAIVKHIVQAHGGTVGAQSAGPGQGSRFWFTLPLARV